MQFDAGYILAYYFDRTTVFLYFLVVYLDK